MKTKAVSTEYDKKYIIKESPEQVRCLVEYKVEDIPPMRVAMEFILNTSD